MNCKPGDLAILVASDIPVNVGEIYTILRPYDGEPMSGDPAWWVEYRGEEWHCRDKNLRPIRPQSDDAVDQMVLLVGKPEKATS